MKEDFSNLKMRDAWSIKPVDPREACKWVSEWAHSFIWMRYQYWRRQLDIPKSARTIETGCGYAKFSMLLGLTGAQVTLMDYNEDALNAAITVHEKLGLHPKSVAANLLEPLEQMQGSFDVVCSFGTLEHFAGDGRLKALCACAGLLRAGGLIFFTVSNRFGVFYRIAFGLRRMAGLLPSNFFEIPYSRGELMRLAFQAGLEPLQVESVNTMWKDFTYWIGSNVESLLRKMVGIKKPPSHLPAESGTPEQLLAAIESAPEPKRPGLLGRHFTYSLLFVGRKTLNDHPRVSL